MAKVVIVDRGTVEFVITDGELRHRWIKVAYLIRNDILEKIDAKKIRPEVFDVIDEHVSAYINKGVNPPEPIATTIHNLADEYLSTGGITLRTGDYISIKTFLRERT